MIEEFKGTQNGVKNHVNTLETGVKPRQPEWRFDHAQFQDEAFLQRAKASLEKHQAHLDAMSPQEREASSKRMEELQKQWDYGTTPEGKKDFAAFFVRSMKKQGKLLPNIDHLWLNLPSGWAEYREVPATEANGAPTSIVTLGRTPTQEEWDAYQTDLQAKKKTWRAEKARKEVLELHGGDPRYDPMTGDFLLPDEHPLSPTSSYLFEGKTRPRRFLPPDSPFLKNAKPLQAKEVEDVPETEYHERLVQRLRKAGFVEVEPTTQDKRYYTFCERLRNMSPEEAIPNWLDLQRESRVFLGTDEKSWGWILGEVAIDFFDLLMRLLLGLPPEDEEKKKAQGSH